MSYTITLADGTELSELSINGNNYVSPTKVDESVFEDNCSPITFTDEKGEQVVYNNGVFVQQAHYKDGYYLSFRDKSPDEIANEDLNAKIDYIAMMQGIDL